MDILNSQNKSVIDIIERTRRSVPKLPDPQWFHVFFIYKTILPDKDIATKLLQNLEVLGYKCGNHKNDFVPGKTVIQNVHDCLQKSLTLVILLSKEFCSSEWCKYDLEVAQNLKIKKRQKLQIIPLVLDDCDIPDLISHTTYLEIDMENINAWHGRFLRTVYESMNVDNAIVHSSSSSSICQICERFIGDTTNEEDKDEEDIQLDKEVQRYIENMFPKTYYDNDDLISKSECHVTYPEFMLLQKRLSSFNEFNWTSKGLPDPRVMAINGFFLSSNGSAVRCFQCGISLFDWSPEDDPEFEHARWSPKCPYIIAKQGQQYIDLVAEAVREVEMMEEDDYSYFEIEMLLESLKIREMLPGPRGLSSSLVKSPKWESLSSLSSINISSESLTSAIPVPRKESSTFKSGLSSSLVKSPKWESLSSLSSINISSESLPSAIPVPRKERSSFKSGLSSSLVKSPKWESLSSLSSINISSESLPSAIPVPRKERSSFKSANDLEMDPHDSGLYSTFGSAESFEVLPTRLSPRRRNSF